MPRKTITIERQELYNEVWTEPVTKVAKKYGLSDVGLKKICRKLVVPTPPLGYWARLQHGKSPPRIALPKSDGPTVYEHAKYVPYIDEQVAERLVLAKAATPSSATPVTLNVRTRIQECHVVARQLAKELNGKNRDSRDWPIALGDGVLGIAVSPDHQNRAVLVADLVLRYCSQAKFSQTKSKDASGCIDVNGEQFKFRISEKSARQERKPTPDEKDDARRFPTLYGDRIYYTYQPTGILRLDVMRSDSSYPLFSLRDGKVKTLEDSISELPAKLEFSALQATVQKEVNRERAKKWEILRAEQARLDARQASALQKLKEVEKAAEDWDRAKRLRDFAAALRATGAAEENADLIDWILRAADWVDPLVDGSMPEVGSGR